MQKRKEEKSGSGEFCNKNRNRFYYRRLWRIHAHSERYKCRFHVVGWEHRWRDRNAFQSSLFRHRRSSYRFNVLTRTIFLVRWKQKVLKWRIDRFKGSISENRWKKSFLFCPAFCQTRPLEVFTGKRISSKYSRSGGSRKNIWPSVAPQNASFNFSTVPTRNRWNFFFVLGIDL